MVSSFDRGSSGGFSGLIAWADEDDVLLRKGD